MFLSQKGSLGRNPMINRVGQRLLQLFEGASAAYSLRDLASNIASVVRVRRASDNSEKDFSAVDVSSGAMTQWVNAQIVPPLDVRELVDGERTGALIPAAAAYSLRNLSASYTGDVVDVRRSSDDAEDSFTAAEVADGTLTDWVNEDLGITFETAEPTTSGATVTNASSTGFTYSSSSTGVRGARIPFSQSIPAGAEISITLTVSNEVGSMTPSVRLASDSSSQLAASATPSTFTSDASGTQTFVGTTTSTTTSLAFFDNVVGSFDVSNVTINYIRYNGHVTQWYDQSGNANHATQGTDASQPKIVDAGVLLTTGGNPSVDFYNNSLLETSAFTDGSASSIFSVINNQSANSTRKVFYTKLDFPNKGVVWNYRGDRSAGEYDFVSYDGSTNSLTSSDSTSPFHFVSSTIINSDKEVFINGTSKATSSDTFVLDDGSLALGDAVFGTGFDFQEIIIYGSDQSDNRTAFEANIGETYGIDLPSGVDTGYDQVDGFVETWYDQSGNGNDAVQATAGSQPKIVDAGVLVTDRDGKVAINGKSSTLYPPSNAPMLSSDGTYSLFAAVDFDDQRNGNEAFNNIIGFVSKTDGGASSFRKPLIYAGQDNGEVRLTSPSNPSGTASLTLLETVGVQLLTNIANPALSTGNNTAYVDGVLVSSVNSNTDVNTEILTGTASRLFDLQETTVETFLSEVIYYPSDQSANRVAIETNINNQYDIY